MYTFLSLVIVCLFPIASAHELVQPTEEMLQSGRASIAQTYQSLVLPLSPSCSMIKDKLQSFSLPQFFHLSKEGHALECLSFSKTQHPAAEITMLHSGPVA